MTSNISNLSQKNRRNLSVSEKYIYKSNGVRFMELSNQNYLTRTVYNMHKNNNGICNYLRFKTIVPKTMEKWASSKNINQISNLNGLFTHDILYHLNKMFIEENADLYKRIEGAEYNDGVYYSNAKHANVPDLNVYKSVIDIGYDVNELGFVNKNSKKYEDMLAQDIQNLDVWAEQTVETNFADHRYKNTIPVWQRSVNIRHYDRTNDGLQHIDAKRASINNQLHGYNMDLIYKAKGL